MKNPVRYFRLLPAVIFVGLGLLAVKGAGLALEARAEDSQSTKTEQPAETTAPTVDLAAEDSESDSASQVDVLGSLAKRRAELDAREQELTMRENLIAAAEQKVDGKIADLKGLQSQIQVLLGQRDDAEKAQIAALVKTYSLMKAKDAARIFNSLDQDVLMQVAQAMKPDVLGAILAQMQSDQAKDLTVKLANRLKPPKTTPPPQQVVALQPPVTDPSLTQPIPEQQIATTNPVVTPPVTTPPVAAKVPVKADVKADPKPQAKADVKPVDTKPADVKSDVKTEAKADVKPETKVEAKNDVKVDAKVDAKADPKAPKS